MATLQSKRLFFVTSPRTPVKMRPEIQLLCEMLEGQTWNHDTQERFIEALSTSDFFEGSGSFKDKAFSARDRITRGPKALGFVDLPNIRLTDAGKAFVYGNRSQEIFLRQLMKFQLPSPYHKEGKQTCGVFFVKPYLEIFRMIYKLGYLTFDEFELYMLQLTDYRKFSKIQKRIERFREKKAEHKGAYKKFFNEQLTKEIRRMYRDRLAAGQTKTRESRDRGLKEFIKTQKGNLRDYTDAAFRYLRYTGLFSIAHRSKRISIYEERIPDVEFLLEHVSRAPVFISDKEAYKEQLFAADRPVLYVDDREHLLAAIVSYGDVDKASLESKTLDELKDIRDAKQAEARDSAIRKEVADLKSYQKYQDILDVYDGIKKKDFYDGPLMFEYNTWRAMTMLDGGDIKGNFKFDDHGEPLSTAPGNGPDIECDYGDFCLSVEVTLQNGAKQYEMEGEPVARHYGALKKKMKKDTYCLFITPKLNDAAVAHFRVLNCMNTRLYGGSTKIVPITLEQFVTLLGKSCRHATRTSPQDIRNFLNAAIAKCCATEDEIAWAHSIDESVGTWLAS